MSGRFKLWDFFRKRVIWILIALLVPSFVLFFHAFLGSPPTAGPGGDAGELFGRRVAWEEFQEEYQWLRRQLTAQWGELPESFEPFLFQQTWDRLLLRAEAQRRRIEVGDAEVAQLIRSQAIFQQEGRFDPELYSQYVRSIRTTPQRFEGKLREQLQVDKLLAALRAEVTLADEELRAAYVEEHEPLSAALVIVSAETLRAQALAELTPEELQAYYETHADAVRIPERIVLDVLGTSRPLLLKDLTITDEAIRTYYEDHPEEFRDEGASAKPLEQVAESIRLRLAEEESQKRLTTFALDLEDDLAAGRSLEEIAEARGLSIRRSEPLSVGQSLLPDGPDAEMVQKAFDLAAGETSQVLESPAGVFVIRLVERIAQYLPPFEEVRETIERLASTERARGLARQRAETIREDLASRRAEGLTFDEACRVLGIEPHRPAPFTRQGIIEPLGYAPEVAAAAFQTEPGQLSDVLESPQGFVIVFVIERLGIDEAQFATDRETFRERVLQTKQQERLTDWLLELRSRAKLKSFLDQAVTPGG